VMASPPPINSPVALSHWEDRLTTMPRLCTPVSPSPSSFLPPVVAARTRLARYHLTVKILRCCIIHTYITTIAPRVVKNHTVSPNFQNIVIQGENGRNPTSAPAPAPALAAGGGGRWRRGDRAGSAFSLNAAVVRR